MQSDFDASTMIDMTKNSHALVPFQLDPSDMYTMDSNHDNEDDYDDYDDDFLDALMHLDDDMEDATYPDDDLPENRTSVPLIDEEIGQEPYLVLEAEDIVCGGTHSMTHHPGNIFLERIVSDFVLPYGLATKEPEREALLDEVYSQIEMASSSAGRRPPRYVFFAAVSSDGLFQYRLASQDEIKGQIKCSIKSHFNVIPTPYDVLFGRGQPCRDFSGNIRLRTFIDSRRSQYSRARPMDKKRMVQVTRESVTAVGGRFLLPFDKARPSDGCVEAPNDAICRKIAHLYRDNTNLRQEGIVMAQAHPVEEVVLPVPMYHHCRPEVAPLSASTKDTETIQTPDTSVKILDGVSITSSSNRSTGTAASSHASFIPLVDKLKTFLFKWPTNLLSMIIVVAVVIVVISVATVSKGGVTMSTLQTVQRRGKLICGVTNQIGYSTLNVASGLWMGFEVDICRAQAAAIFGKERFYPFSPRSSEPVDYVPLITSERFRALKNKTVDILLAVTSQTMERAVYESTTKSGYTFSTPYLVNEVAFAGHPDDLECLENYGSNTTDFGLCNDVKICVLWESTHQDILLAENLDPASIVTPNGIDDFYNSFLDDDCNILIGEKFDLAEQHLSARGYTGPYKVGDKVLAKEYISLVTRDSDVEFSDFCNWILQSLFSAEEGFQMEETHAFGDLNRNMFRDAISVVGDYGHLYDLYLEDFVPRSPTNHINNGSFPEMFAIPMGKTLSSEPPLSTSSPTMEEIISRGVLYCGITDTPFFATLNENNDWVGLDIDFCNGVAAGLFDGEFKEHVKFIQLNPDARFDALGSRKVDVLARATTITFERDVELEKAGVGFSFSFPNFFDSIKFAGSPELVQCAQNRDSTSHRCSTLHFCVTNNTTQSDLIHKTFPNVPKTLSESTSRNVASLEDGECNVLVGGSADIFQVRSQSWFEERFFVVGTKQLSRESLALVTRDDDPFWSKFVNWVVLATIYAEEHNITQATYWEMPHVNLFGPTIDDEMLRDVIRAVGSYAEIWQRHATFGNFLVREGRNLLAASSHDTSPLLRSDLFWDDP